MDNRLCRYSSSSRSLEKVLPYVCIPVVPLYFYICNLCALKGHKLVTERVNFAVGTWSTFCKHVTLARWFRSYGTCDHWQHFLDPVDTLCQ